MLKKILIAGLVLAVIGGAIGYYMYNKPHRDIFSEDPIFTGEVSELSQTLSESDSLFNALYTDQVVTLTGAVTNVGESSFTFENIVICSPDSTVGLTPFARGAELTIKGRIVGTEEDLIEGYIIRMDHVHPVQ